MEDNNPGDEQSAEQREDDNRQLAQPTSIMEALANADNDPKSTAWLQALLLALVALGVYEMTANQHKNLCAMTYMFEYPQYIQVHQDSKYGLYAYAEGKWVDKVEKGNFKGIPVLFVPGNAGSHKQVRSLASVGLRKALEGAKDEEAKLNYDMVHFDYFSVDFNEEFSALYGGTLKAQSEFVSKSIDHILSLYKDPATRPKSVVLVGHSIGGIVAKSVFKKFQDNKINIVITLATPHKPVVVMDYHTRSFYDEVDTFWNSSVSTSSVTLVSVGGGDRDLQVRSDLTRSLHSVVSVTTSHAPSVWASTDHRCIVWCKQLVLAINRALFDCVDRTTRQITTKTGLRTKVFQYHLLSRSAGKKYKPENKFKDMAFNENGFWADGLKRQFVFVRDTITEDSHLIIRLLEDKSYEMVTIEGVNIGHDDWIFGCKDTKVHRNTRICMQGINLSAKSEIIPSNGKRKAVTFDMRDLAHKHGYTHLVVYIPKKSENIRVNIDVYTSKERTFVYEVPRWITFWKSYPIVPKTEPTALFYNISLGGMESPWQAYNIKVSPLRTCQENNHLGLMRFVTPWAHDTTQALIGSNMTDRLIAKLQTPRHSSLNLTEVSPSMLIHLNPSCQYKIEIQASLGQMWSQMIRVYAPLLASFILTATLLTLTQQIKMMDKTGDFPSFLSTVTVRVTPISVVMPGRFLSFVLTTTTLSRFLPKTDLNQILDEGLDFTVLHIVLFFVAIGIVTFISVAAWYTVVVVGNVANKVVTKFFVRQTMTTEVVADLVITGISKVPFLISGVLMSVAAATCGSVALCLGTFIYFVRLFQLYEDYLKSLLKETLLSSEDESKSKLRNIHFQFSILLLWALTTVLNLPSLLAYTRELPFAQGHPLSPDPSFFIAVVFSVSLAVTWSDQVPKKNLGLYPQLSNLMQLCCVLMVLFGSIDIYRSNYFLAVAILALVVHQLMAPTKTPSATPEEPSQEEVDVVDGSNTAGTKGTEE